MGRFEGLAPAGVMPDQEVSERVVEKTFRLKDEENAEFEALVQYAHATGFIKRASHQEFMQFALNCTRSWLKEYEMQRRGLK